MAWAWILLMQILLISMMMINDLKTAEEKYLTVLQTQMLLADTQNIVGEMGRGAGKSTEMLAPRLVRVAYAMPRSILLLVGPTYVFLLENIMPMLITYLNTVYVRGMHFEYGKQPPKHFRRPYTGVHKWNHTISFAWGTVVQLVSVDRPESAIGKSGAHIFIDEWLRIKEDVFRERILPTLRGDRHIFGKCCYFAGISGFSSTPNFENDHDWWLEFEGEMDRELIKEIQYAAYRVLSAEGKMELTTSELKKTKYSTFIKKWSARLNEKRKGQWYYQKGSSFSNLRILGLDYMKQQLSGNRGNFDKFKLSILGIRPFRVKNMFFGNFSKKNIYIDSYKNTNLDIVTVGGKVKMGSRNLVHCDPNKPILAGWDPGYFMSIVFAQEKKREIRIFKNMHVIHPDQHGALAKKIDKYFEFHKKKELILHYDRAGNQKRQAFKKNPKGETDAQILKTELEDMGWTVQLMSMGKRTIYYWEHYVLLGLLFGGDHERLPEPKICQYECEELISSIYMSPLKKTDGVIELDKTSEKTLDYEDQVFWSPQIATALMYLFFGLYEKQLPNKSGPSTGISGI